MKQDKLFTREQLKELGKSAYDRIEQATSAGDYETARKHLLRIRNETHFMHNVYLNWAMDLLAFIRIHHGDEAFQVVFKASIESLYRPLIEQLFAASPEDYSVSEKRLRCMFDEASNLHDAQVEWVTALLSFIGRQYGDEVLYHALKTSMERWFKPLFTQLSNETDAKQRLRLFVSGLTGHYQPCIIEEDDEKFTITYDCGSGGRMAARGRYEPPVNFSRVERAQPMTYGREDFPTYCVHCAFQEILALEWGMEPWLVVVPPKEIGKEPCKLYIFKEPQAVPRWVYQRVGKDNQDKM